MEYKITSPESKRRGLRFLRAWMSAATVVAFIWFAVYYDRIKSGADRAAETATEVAITAAFWGGMAVALVVAGCGLWAAYHGRRSRAAWCLVFFLSCIAVMAAALVVR